MYRQILDRPYLSRASRVSIVLTPAPPEVRGGTLQILNLIQSMLESREATGVEPILCWLPGWGRYEYSLAGTGSDMVIVPFRAAIEQIKSGAEVTLHVPEFAAGAFASDDAVWRAVRHHDVCVNILNLNHHVLPGRRVFNQLKLRSRRVTMTADIWATPAYEEVFGVKVHWVPVWIWPTDIARVPFSAKRDIMIVSPDSIGQPFRDRVIQEIAAKIDALEIVVVRQMPFKQYCELEAAAKWSITFGEGHDGYFIGPAMRGGVPFAVYNDTFVGWNRSEWRTLYEDYDAMASRIVGDLTALNQEREYSCYAASLGKMYRTGGVLAVMRRQVIRFCAGMFDYYPGPMWRPADFSDCGSESISVKHPPADWAANGGIR